MSNQKQQKFLKWYQPVHDRFERFCRARAYADMPYEDLMNESLLIAYQKMDQLQDHTAILSFLIGISRRVLANHYRKKKPIALSEDHAIHQFPDQSNEVERLENVDLLHFALAQLPPLQQEALILFEISGFSIKEIGALQQSGISAVKQRLARGRKQLEKIVKAQMTIQKTI